MDEINNEFGLPTATETPDQRTARIRAKADAVAAQEAEAEEVARLVAADRATRAIEAIPTDTSAFEEIYDRVEIYEGRDKNDSAYVPLGINGFVIKVPRGEEVILPRAFTEVLEHAIETLSTQTKNGITIRDAHRFPFSKRGTATKAEYQSYQAKQRAKADTQLAAAA